MDASALRAATLPMSRGEMEVLVAEAGGDLVGELPPPPSPPAGSAPDAQVPPDPLAAPAAQRMLKCSAPVQE